MKRYYPDIQLFFIIIGLAFTVYMLMQSHNQRRLIQKEGKEIIGLVIETKSRLKRGKSVKYKYWTGGKWYYSWAKTYNRGYDVGDTITIVYYIGDPSISRAKFQLE